MRAAEPDRGGQIEVFTFRFMAIAGLVVAVVATGALPPGGPVPANAALFNISEQQEIQIGREVERQLRAKPGFIDDPGLTANLTEIGHKLAAVSERPNLPWTYHILKDSSVNALAAPGGYIFATRGLFGFVKSQDELAFVIGHETTHVAHRHAVDLAQKDMQLQFGALIVTQVLFGGSWPAYMLSQLGRNLIDAKYSRDKEYEADHFGVIYARKVGYDPTQSIAFFDRLRQQEKAQPGMARAFENHPDTPARIGALCTELTGMGYRVNCPVKPGAAPQPGTSGAAAPTPVPPAGAAPMSPAQEHN
ncbi:MAG TPA: M48 family metalloprotease [bacterium]|nr:M48 family metalloprotease [bacterium]